MQPNEVFRLINRRLRRGVILFKFLQIVSIVGTGAALLFPSWRPWAATAFLGAVLFGVAWIHVRGMYHSAWKLCNEPQIVYWAYSVDKRGHISEGPTATSTRLVLHLRDGTKCEIGLSASEMEKFVTWLKESNPSVRWGDFDKSETETIRVE
jgi:hypothetical protein